METEMKAPASRARTNLFNRKRSGLLLLALACLVSAAGKAQNAAAKPASAAAGNPAGAGGGQ